MFLRADGHLIAVLTDADISEEDRAVMNAAVTAKVDESGHLEARLAGSEDKATIYEVHSSDDSRIPGDFSLVRPPGGDVPMDLASLRPFRLTKDSRYRKQDSLHQLGLFHAIGSATVAGGHVEMAMKKVLVTIRGGQNEDLANVPADWNKLQDELEKICRNPTSQLELAVSELLAGNDLTELREGRNDIVHGYWWLVPIGENRINMSRYFRPNKGAPKNLFGTTAGLQEFANRLFQLAEQLEALVTPYWPLAIVPAMGRCEDKSGIVALEGNLRDEKIMSADLRLPASGSRPIPGQRPARGKNAKRRGRGRGRGR